MDNKPITRALLFSCVLFVVFVSSHAQTCKSYTFKNNQQYSACSDLSVLSSFLHWNYDSSTNVVDLAFRHIGTTSSRWTAWALNPSGQRMAGSQCLVAFQTSTGAIRAYTSPISGGMPSLQEGSLSFQVMNLNATLEGDEMTIFARLQLNSELLSTNQVWQEGPMSGDAPGMHATSGNNMVSVGSIDFRTGQTASNSGSINSRERRRNVHGVLNAVSWGTLMPLGAMIARYLKVFKSAHPAWFYLHVACQSSAYIVGVAGWATGIKLGQESSVTANEAHRDVGIALFCLGTLQMFALLLRPKPDHKYRVYWNIYHHTMGYAVIGMSIFNVLCGLSVLDPELKWWHTYISILAVLGVTGALLEAITWYIVIKRKKQHTQKISHNTNGSVINGANGYAARTENEV